jgi:hypothetical protein
MVSPGLWGFEELFDLARDDTKLGNTSNEASVPAGCNEAYDDLGQLENDR